MFSDFDIFKQVLIAMFDNTGKDCRAAIELINLRQAVLVVAYTTKFQQLHAKAGWQEEKVCIIYFYNRLSNKIKDQMSLSRQDRPEVLEQIICLATDIGDRINKQNLEYKRLPSQPSWGYRQQNKQLQQKSWPQPIDLDIIQTNRNLTLVSWYWASNTVFLYRDFSVVARADPNSIGRPIPLLGLLLYQHPGTSQHQSQYGRTSRNLYN